MEALWAQWSYMGNGGTDADHVSFLVFRLRKRNFGVMLVYVWYMFWWCFDICFDVMFGHMYLYVYGCKYRHEICYKAPISGMGFMLLWCYIFHVTDWFALQQVDNCKYCNELSYKDPRVVCFLFSGFSLGICVIEHWGWCPPRGRIL